MPERNFQFRQRLNTVHLPDRRDPKLLPDAGDTVVADGWRIVFSTNRTEYLTGVAQDLQDYFFTSMQVSTLLTRGQKTGLPAILLTTKDETPHLGEGLTKPRSYRIIVEPDVITVCGFDERGVGQGCYYLEDLMNLREGPFLPEMDVVRAPIFSPRMIHSGWGIDQFPDQHLNAIAHAGMDAVLVFVASTSISTAT